ncbi:MAG: NTP transferase domain-containing protein [Spirochaetota bacterium]|nr:NTP transferase domain-containing protein [Spirochaetota bacterium]
MQYICLAAGKGTRFNRLGSYLQKCMYPIGGVPFLQFSIDNLLNSGAFEGGRDKLVIVVGHFAEQVRAYFTEAHRGVPVHYVEQGETAGTGHAVLRAFEEHPFSEPAVVWLADTYIDAEQFRSIGEYREKSVLTLARHVCGREHDERVSLDPGGTHVTCAWRGTSEYVDIGLWKVPPSIVDSLLSHRTDEHRFLPVVQGAIQEGLEVAAMISQQWIHLGGTEPSVTENIRAVTRALLQEASAYP